MELMGKELGDKTTVTCILSRERNSSSREIFAKDDYDWLELCGGVCDSSAESGPLSWLGMIGRLCEGGLAMWERKKVWDEL